MPKAIVIYESMFGNTKRAAETIVAGMKEAGTEAVISTPKEAEEMELTGFDAIVIGSPNHMGSPTKGIRKFIDGLEKLGLEKKMAAVFDVHTKDYEKAVKKMEKQLGEKAPGLTLATPGLSLGVVGMRGPISESELSKCKEFGLVIANRLQG
jgi:flavodoxin